MILTVASMFRDSESHIPRYFRQISALREEHTVRLLLAAGDSTDSTNSMLVDHLRDEDRLYIVDHGGPRFGSVDHPDRWAQIAQVFSKLVSNVDDVGDAFVWVESDLVWLPETISELVRQLEWWPAVCPMVFSADGSRFYDVWGFRKDGRRFEPNPPYHDMLGDGSPVRIDSCGSCFACRPEVFPQVQEWGGLWPLRLPQASLWLDRTVSVVHP